MRAHRKNTWTVAAILTTAAALTTVATPAFAHFTLKKPTSWLKEDPSAVGGGGPQKGGPCGPGGIDNVNPIPTSGVVTDFHVGETIELDWVDTIAHPGHFRIALAESRDDLKNPTIVQDGSCNYDESMVPKTPSGNVLADGVFFRSRNGFNAPAGHMFTYMVTLPDTPCDKCTLQVMQVMENDIKALSNCYYFHCADIRILPAGASTGTGGASGAGGDMSVGGVTGGGGLTGLGGTLGVGGFLGGAGLTGVAGMLGGGGILGSGGLVGTAGAVGGAGAPSGAGNTPNAGISGMTGAAGGVEAIPNGTAGAAATPAPDDGSDGGCSVSTTRHGTALAIPALIALFTLAGRRRKARRQ